MEYMVVPRLPVYPRQIIIATMMSRIIFSGRRINPRSWGRNLIWIKSLGGSGTTVRWWRRRPRRDRRRLYTLRRWELQQSLHYLPKRLGTVI